MKATSVVCVVLLLGIGHSRIMADEIDDAIAVIARGKRLLQLVDQQIGLVDGVGGHGPGTRGKALDISASVPSRPRPCAQAAGDMASRSVFRKNNNFG